MCIRDRRNTVLAQITLDQVQVTGGKGNKVAIGVIAYKDDCAGQVTLASQDVYKRQV